MKILTTFPDRTRLTRLIACTLVLTALCGLPALALPRSTILHLRDAARAHYPDQGDVMNEYTVMVYRGKAYGTTRGTVGGVPTIAIWELVDRWHFILDAPLSQIHSPEVEGRIHAYGFKPFQERRLFGVPHPFPAGQ